MHKVIRHYGYKFFNYIFYKQIHFVRGIEIHFVKNRNILHGKNFGTNLHARPEVFVYHLIFSHMILSTV